MQKGAKSIFLIDKKNAHILQRKTKKANRVSACRLWTNVPKIYPKWQNETSQMAKWDIPNDGLGHRGHE